MQGMHIHIGLLDFLIFVAYLIIAKFFLHTLAGLTADGPLGQALSFLS